jgi:hypothetical protein
MYYKFIFRIFIFSWCSEQILYIYTYIDVSKSSFSVVSGLLQRDTKAFDAALPRAAIAVCAAFVLVDTPSHTVPIGVAPSRATLGPVPAASFVLGAGPNEVTVMPTSGALCARVHDFLRSAQPSSNPLAEIVRSVEVLLVTLSKKLGLCEDVYVVLGALRLPASTRLVPAAADFMEFVDEHLVPVSFSASTEIVSNASAADDPAHF